MTGWRALAPALATAALMLCLAAACVTPMTEREIDDLTRCEGRSRAAVRVNLVRRGYRIETDTERGIETDFRLLGDDGERRYYRRLRLTALGGEAWRINVTYREEAGLPGTVAREYAEAFYAEEAELHAAVWREVCRETP